MTNDILNIAEEANGLVVTASKYDVKNQLVYDEAANFCKTLLTMKKRIELFFEPSINQFKKAKAEAEAGRKAETEKMEKYVNPIDQAITLVRNKCKEYENQKERERIEAQRVAEEEAKKKTEVLKEWGETDVVVEVEKVAPKVEKTSGLGIRRVWKWKVVDETKIPREFFALNEVAVNKVVREKQGETKINGIDVYFE